MKLIRNQKLKHTIKHKHTSKTEKLHFISQIIVETINIVFQNIYPSLLTKPLV